MLEFNRTKCCGLRELHGIQIQDYSIPLRRYRYRAPTVQEIIGFVQHQMQNGKDGAFVTFAAATGNGHDKAGDDLAAYIRKEKLGKLNAPVSALNPNSHHQLKVWVWRVDRAKLRAWRLPKPTKK